MRGSACSTPAMRSSTAPAATSTVSAPTLATTTPSASSSGPRTNVSGKCLPTGARPGGKAAPTSPGQLVEEPGDVLQPAVLDEAEVGAPDRRVDAVRAQVRAQAPRQAHVVAEAVGGADLAETEVGKAVLHALDHLVDP